MLNDSCSCVYRYTLGANGSVYAIVNDWPSTDSLDLGCPRISSQSSVSLVGYSGSPITMTTRPAGGVTLNIGAIAANQLPCEWAWVFRFNGLKQLNQKWKTEKEKRYRENRLK